MIYEELAPSPVLAPFVDRLWVLEGPADSAAVDPILPDGHTEVIVHAGDPFFEQVDGRLSRQAPVLLAGQLTRAVHITPGGTILVAGARLLPHGAFALFGVPQSDLTDRIVDLSLVHGRLARQLRDDASGRSSGPELVAALDRALSRMVPRPELSAVVRAVGAAISSHGLTTVGALAESSRLSERQLERVFKTEVGVSPKRLLRTLRFQQVLRQLRGEPGAGRWTEIALTAGFYDQAHFVNDFRSFTGRRPSDWAIDDSSLTAVFSALRRRGGREGDEGSEDKQT